MSRVIVVSRAWFVFIIASVVFLWLGFGALAYTQWLTTKVMNNHAAYLYELVIGHMPQGPASADPGLEADIYNEGEGRQL